GHTTEYLYDRVNRLITAIYPDGGMRSLTYDPVGYVLTRTDQKGQTIIYAYDELNRLRQRSYPLSPPDNFSYDPEGRMLSAKRGNWLVSFQYDGADRVIGSVQNGQHINYSYDIPGHTRTIIYPGGRVITEHMDFRQRLSTIDDGPSIIPLVRYDYDL